MTVIIDSTHLATLVAAGTENRPVIGIDSVFTRAGSLTTGGATNVRALDGATYTYWKPETANSSITYDLDVASDCDMAGIASHNFGGRGYEIAIEYWNGSAWTQAGDRAAPTTNETIIWLFESVTADQWRCRVISGSGDDYVIGVLFIGRRITLDRPFYQDYNPARTPTEVELLANTSGAHVLGTSVIGRGSRVTWNLQYLTEAQVYSLGFGRWIKVYNEGQGFFSAWRPADYSDAYYGWRDGAAIQMPNSGPLNRKSLQFGMRVYQE